MIDDPVLPAAAHLTGPHAHDVVATALAATGAELVSCRPVQVQYRPGADLIVRYATTVRRGDTTDRETLLAGTTLHAEPPGTLPVEATTDGGDVVRAGLWRWPFDPVLTDLERIVTPALLAESLAGVVVAPIKVEVIVYRPCERVVVRVDDAAGRQCYVKAVPPHAVADLVDRHVRLAAAGVPVPTILATGGSWIAMSAVIGPTLRELIKAPDAASRWPQARSITRMLDRFAGADLHHVRPARRRLSDAAAHAAMLATVHPGERDRLVRLAGIFDRHAAVTASRCGPIVHADLHEGQLIVDGGEITGVLDVDDAGPGDPIDDVANLIGHLRYRALTAGNGVAVARYAAALRRAAADAHDGRDIDVAVAAVLTGLATGPFRIQQADWQRSVSAVLDAAAALVDGLADEKDLSEGSSTSNPPIAP